MFSTAVSITEYLLHGLLPLWREKGLDRKTGFFHGSLNLDGRPPDTSTHRLLVQCRQIYVFSHAHLLGAPQANLDAAVRGFEALERFFWDPVEGGWLRSLDTLGQPLDGRKDTYDHAFVLFACAYFHRAAGGDRALRVAAKTLDLIEDRLADPLMGGFMEAAERDWTLISEPRRQNPHMHLFEAFLAMYDASGDERYLLHAHRIFELFRNRFFDRTHGCLGEYFDRDWRKHPTQLGAITEPGHHFEWVWLLHAYGRVASSDEALDYADRLFGFARSQGWDTLYGGAFDQVDPKGKILRDGKRVWPQTEFLKACAARLEAGFDGALADLAEGLKLCASRHLDSGTGLWKELFSRDGAVLASGECPATSVYHIFLGLSEAARVLAKTENH